MCQPPIRPEATEAERTHKVIGLKRLCTLCCGHAKIALFKGSVVTSCQFHGAWIVRRGIPEERLEADENPDPGYVTFDDWFGIR